MWRQRSCTVRFRLPRQLLFKGIGGVSLLDFQLIINVSEECAFFGLVRSEA